VYVACGYYDLATPLFAAEYSINHMLLDPSLRKNVVFGYYEAGHMLYTQAQSLAKSKQELAKFYAGAMPQ
jgi:carboxypeptidase C (cathepsin A)